MLSLHTTLESIVLGDLVFVGRALFQNEMMSCWCVLNLKCGAFKKLVEVCFSELFFYLPTLVLVLDSTSSNTNSSNLAGFETCQFFSRKSI